MRLTRASLAARRLDDCGVKPEQLKLLALATQTKKAQLKTLSLKGNSTLGNEGIKLVVSLVQEHAHLVKVNLAACFIGSNVSNAFRQHPCEDAN